ncbi:hypothetical protein DPMN_018886 [Dreissena polymorpha]|uniref:Uncharacterized protein n=1 Tax=Dreissena polymorpha TaxID=45954 RepID=A0A9D4NJB1_DREPO|nr:hypothetical protein DPMN_018886 [Dreissena polymorpha]
MTTPLLHKYYNSLKKFSTKTSSSDYQASYQYLLPCWVHQFFQQQSLGEFDFRLSIDVA